eukprot:1394111-Amorphochlora_amoeboformis.AAC.2
MHPGLDLRVAQTKPCSCGTKRLEVSECDKLTFCLTFSVGTTMTHAKRENKERRTRKGSKLEEENGVKKGGEGEGKRRMDERWEEDPQSCELPSLPLLWEPEGRS